MWPPNLYPRVFKKSLSSSLHLYPTTWKAPFTAVHLQASRLVLYLLQSAEGQDDRLFGYGEDTELLARDLERWIAKDGKSTTSILEPDGPPLLWTSAWLIYSLSERVRSELAAHDGDYARALNCLADSLMRTIILDHGEARPPQELVDSYKLPWLSGSELPAQQASDWFEELKKQPSKHDWGKLAKTCSDLAGESAYVMATVDKYEEVEHVEWDIYWQRACGWAEAQLTPDQLRNLLEDREDAAAESRLRSYFFNEAQWRALSDRARDTLVSADRGWVSSRNKAQILNSLRVAAEDILYHYLWTPFVEWAKGQGDQDLSRLRRVQGRLRKRAQEPAMGDYEEILLDDGVGRYLSNHCGLEVAQVDFVRIEAKKQFKKLRESRNVAERRPNQAVTSERVRDIYAEFLGIGARRLAVLPELVCILSKP